MTEIYETRIVTFLDILGFTQAVENEGETENILAALLVIQGHVGSHYESDFYNRYKGVLDTEISAFSDSIIISGSDDQAIAVLLETAKFAALLLKNGFLCRGAVSVGKMYHKKGIIFGQAYINAYRAESKRAIYPRIIVDKETEETLLRSEQHPGDLAHLLKKDVDGEKYIDLKIINSFANVDGYVEGMMINILSSLPVGQKTPSIQQKHEWLTNSYELAKFRPYKANQHGSK